MFVAQFAIDTASRASVSGARLHTVAPDAGSVSDGGRESDLLIVAAEVHAGYSSKNYLSRATLFVDIGANGLRHWRLAPRW
jgi:hypothetical protein